MNCKRIGQNCSINDSTLNEIKNNIEVIIFGKGVGECLLLKSKNGEYIVIDSFINDSTGNPVVLDYLDKFSVPYSQIKMIIISHWHNDHILGISRVIRAAGKNVKVVINPIIKKEKYREFLSKQVQKEESDATEFNNVMIELNNSNIKRIIPIADKCIYANVKDDIKLTALSPQDEEFDKYIDDLLEELVKTNTSYKVPDENLLSIVILLEICGETFLLSSDMENRKNSGWFDIINNYKFAIYPKSKYYKVAHHGSKTGDNPDIWDKLLVAKPLSFTTLFNRSNLPSDEDINRISNYSKELYIIGERNKRDNLFESDLRKNGMNQKAYSVSQQIGMVRIIFNKSDYEIEAVGAVTKYTS